MATAYLTPGVYVEEVSTGARPILAVGTSTAAFVGQAPNAAAHPGLPIAINNWTQFMSQFVGDATEGTPLAHAVYGFFQNGGSRCFVVNHSDAAALQGADRTGLRALEAIDEVSIVAAPGRTDAASYKALLDHCEAMGDRIAILDAPAQVAKLEDLQSVGRPTSKGRAAKSDDGEAGSDGGGGGGVRPEFAKGGYGAFYFPWLVVSNPFATDGASVTVPPSGHLAGVYARTDSVRGVHKAPANESIRGALDLSFHVTRNEQGPLNDSGVNVIRFFTDRGILIWGARTVDESSSEFRYVSVRRLFNMVKESIEAGTRWVVFEPNDPTLWKSIRRDVNAFLRGLWRDGALMGRTPEEAFFVKCDEENNPSDVIDRGQVIIEIGIAPVKPAEFIIFRIGQSQSGSAES